MRKIICVILVLVFLLIAGYAGYQIYHEYEERQESSDIYTDLGKLVSFPKDHTDTETGVTNPSESGETETAPEVLTVDFTELSSINNDSVAWISIEGTTVNYPVVQGSDNSYYLKHLFNGKWNSSGCIFLDYRVSADMSDRHSIIYGHHMKNGTMFSGLTQYKKQAYYEKHPEGLLITPDTSYQIKFFAGYVASVEDSAWKIRFESDEEYKVWLLDAKERSMFASSITPAVTDRVVTLSTCSYEFDNARFVLHAIIEEAI